MGRYLGKSSCDYVVLNLRSSRQLQAVIKAKHAFLEIDTEEGRSSDHAGPIPSYLKKYMKTDRVPIKVMPCRCRRRCALKRLRKKHGRYVDCTIYYM